jgi:phage shock protein A
MAPSIRENAARHRRHIEELRESLKKLGVNAAAADEHMSEIADRYRIELLRSMKRIEMAEAALNKGGGDG